MVVVQLLFQHVCYAYQAVLVVCVFSLHNILWILCPVLYTKLVHFEGRTTGLADVLDVAEYSPSLTTRQACKVILSDLYFQSCRRASKEFPAPDSRVYSLAGQSSTLLSYELKGRPLVVNFGSITCPIFTDRLKTVHQFYTSFRDVADFLLVYTRESHAADEWPFANARHVMRQHRSIGERLDAAQLLRRHYISSSSSRGDGVSCLTVVADNMRNEASYAYGALPMRLFIIYNGCVWYEGGMGPIKYDVHHMVKELARFRT